MLRFFSFASVQSNWERLSVDKRSIVVIMNVCKGLLRRCLLEQKYRQKFLNHSLFRRYNEKRDYVFVEDLVFHGYHGDLKEEKVLGQKFECSFKLYPKCKRLIQCANTDELNHTLDYTILINEVEKIMQSTSYDMIETLAHEIARNAFVAYGYDRLEAIEIKIKKPQVPITQFAKCVGVNIFRTANDFMQHNGE